MKNEHFQAERQRYKVRRSLGLASLGRLWPSIIKTLSLYLNSKRVRVREIRFIIVLFPFCSCLSVQIYTLEEQSFRSVNRLSCPPDLRLVWPGNKYRGRGNDGWHAMCGKPVEAAGMEKAILLQEPGFLKFINQSINHLFQDYFIISYYCQITVDK